MALARGGRDAGVAARSGAFLQQDFAEEKEKPGCTRLGLVSAPSAAMIGERPEGDAMTRPIFSLRTFRDATRQHPLAGLVRAGAATLVLSMVPAGQALAQVSDAPPARMVIGGEGRVDVAPDMATVRLGVTTEARAARDALAANSAQVAAVLDTLGAAGIAPRDMQTTGLSLGPRWENVVVNGASQSRITGYFATNAVSVRVRDLGSLGAVLDRVVDDGANTLDGLSFGLQDAQSARDEARRRAVADALRKAALYAEATGVALGPILSFREEADRRPFAATMARDMALAESAVPVAEGEVGITAAVEVIFAIGE